MTGKTGKKMEVLGVSLGGGKMEIREINGAASCSAAKSIR